MSSIIRRWVETETDCGYIECRCPRCQEWIPVFSNEVTVTVIPRAGVEIALTHCGTEWREFYPYVAKKR